MKYYIEYANILLIIMVLSVSFSYSESIVITKGEDIAIANPSAVQMQVKDPNKGDATTITAASFKC